MDNEGVFLSRNDNGPFHFLKWVPSKMNWNSFISATSGHGMSCLCKSLYVDIGSNERSVSTIIYDPQSDYLKKSDKGED